MTFLPAIPLAILLDHVLGEPRRWHPLIGFGRLAERVEALLRRVAGAAESRLRAAGVAGVALLVLPPFVVAWWLSGLPQAGVLFQVLALYFALGGRSLQQHAEAVAVELDREDLPAARDAVGRVVSRDTTDLDATGVSRAAVESVLENGNDAVFGALFWFVLLGAPGAIAYRLVNTLDAMWGYRNRLYHHFGWAAARFDDVLNWVPARLTALTYVLFGNWRCGLRCWREQAGLWYSPNAGPVMAAGAGALRVSLGGTATYLGRQAQRPGLGLGPAPTAADIRHAITLVQRGMLLWGGVAIGGILLG